MLRFISLGKYSSVFYHKNSTSHGSVCGGLLTLFVGSFVLIVSIITLYDIFAHKNYNLRSSADDLVAYKMDATTK